jgi:hypothetical protein
MPLLIGLSFMPVAIHIRSHDLYRRFNVRCDWQEAHGRYQMPNSPPFVSTWESRSITMTLFLMLKPVLESKLRRLRRLRPEKQSYINDMISEI